ncbi:MAG: hypothetical protein BYD32DRAFT_193814 [Podila humilis]|nr:MAG: hypothetical protein BYD32DRAFT_193814 [Podila humilis]
MGLWLWCSLSFEPSQCACPVSTHLFNIDAYCNRIQPHDLLMRFFVVLPFVCLVGWLDGVLLVDVNIPVLCALYVRPVSSALFCLARTQAFTTFGRERNVEKQHHGKRRTRRKGEGRRGENRMRSKE